MLRAQTMVLLASLLGLARAAEEPAAPEEARPIALAVIVHPKNPVTKVTFTELRAYLRMERQFWPNNKRCTLYLPSRRTDASSILLDKVYRMTHKQLQVYWVRKLFSGEIPAKPSYVPSAAAAASQVLRSEGAISIVRADEVPDKVRVLLIDGKKPTDEGYPLSGIPRADEDDAES